MKSLSAITIAGVFTPMLLLLVSCASTPMKTSQASVGEAKMKEVAKEYKRSVASIPEENFKGNTCASFLTTMKVKWDWKAAVAAGNSCIRNRDLKKAEEIGNELSVREPSAPWGPYFLASVARDRGELERSLWMSELAMKRAPDLGIVHYLKGQVLWAKKDYSPAIYSFEKCTDLDDSIVPAHLFLGRVYFRDQAYGKASKHFYAALKSNPKNPVALAGLAESQLHDKNSKGALEAYQRLVEAYPSNGLFLTRVAEIYEQNLNDLPQALVTYKILQTRIKSRQVQMNNDLQLDSKIKELEVATHKTRAVAEVREEKKGTLR